MWERLVRSEEKNVSSNLRDKELSAKSDDTQTQNKEPTKIEIKKRNSLGLIHIHILNQNIVIEIIESLYCCCLHILLYAWIWI